MPTDLTKPQSIGRLPLHWQAGTYEWWPAKDRLIWSPELVRLYGLERAPGAEQGFTRLVHPDDRLRVEAETSAFLGSDATGYSHSFRIVRPDGAVRTILDRGDIERDPAGNVRVIRGLNIDITDEAGIGTASPAVSGRIEQEIAGGPATPQGIPADPAGRQRADAALAETGALFRALFDGMPVGIGIWDRDFRFVHVNSELAAINGLPAEAHIGRRPDEILPSLTGFEEIYRNWQRIIETGEPWRGVEISGETPAQPGRIRYWEEDFFPLRNGEGIVGIAAVVQETTRREEAEAHLRASEERYRALFEAIDEGFCVLEVSLDAPDRRIDYRVVEANPAFYDRTGFSREILGRWLREAAPGLEDYWFELYGRVARTGEPVRFEQGSEMLGRWFDVYAFPTDTPEGRRVAVLFNDISERKRQEERTEALLKELDHRSKNMLGLILAIARQTAAAGAVDFVDRFSERLLAMGAAQDLLIRHAWTSVPLDELVRAQLAHFSDLLDNRIEIAGPPLTLTPDATQALGMALHELATNASKHGALSTAHGRISIAWSAGSDDDAEPRVTLSWQERAGPRVAEPETRGFGSVLTTRMVESSTRGEVTVDYAPSGLVWRLTCPAEAVLSRSSAGRVAAGPARTP